MTVSPSASDIARDDWVARLPPLWRAVARLCRLDRPVGWRLLLIPCWQGLALGAAAGGAVRWDLALWFVLGAVAMRAAGCVVNDLADRKIDARVARTADRPLASGALTTKAALAVLAACLAVGLVVVVQLDPVSAAIAFAAIPLVAVYPFMKRVTWWPQAFLGLTFNFGALVGWSAAMGGDLSLAGVLLYLGGVAWTLNYDTIYAHQDKEDDALVGVKSTARRFGDASRPWLYGFAAATTALWAGAGLAAGAAWPWFIGVAAAGVWIFWLSARADFDDPRACLTAFKAQVWPGLLIVAGGIAAI
ncbi:MAG: 4-hydroxybenzoate octaprenyltransferase [Pseudomonadota bacterium]